VVTKEAENIPEYKDFTIEIQGMWKVKAKVIPVIKSDDWNLQIIQIIAYLSNIPGKHEIKEL